VIASSHSNVLDVGVPAVQSGTEYCVLVLQGTNRRQRVPRLLHSPSGLQAVSCPGAQYTEPIVMCKRYTCNNPAHTALECISLCGYFNGPYIRCPAYTLIETPCYRCVGSGTGHS
jgi:hypothetical protein